MTADDQKTERYLVEYDDKKLGRRVREFTDHEEAERFASSKRINGGFCRVEVKTQ